MATVSQDSVRLKISLFILRQITLKILRHLILKVTPFKRKNHPIKKRPFFDRLFNATISLENFDTIMTTLFIAKDLRKSEGFEAKTFNTFPYSF